MFACKGSQKECRILVENVNILGEHKTTGDCRHVQLSSARAKGSVLHKLTSQQASPRLFHLVAGASCCCYVLMISEYALSSSRRPRIAILSAPRQLTATPVRPPWEVNRIVPVSRPCLDTMNCLSGLNSYTWHCLSLRWYLQTFFLAPCGVLVKGNTFLNNPTLYGIAVGAKCLTYLRSFILVFLSAYQCIKLASYRHTKSSNCFTCTRHPRTCMQASH